MVAAATLVGVPIMALGLMTYFGFRPALKMGLESSINLAENGLLYPHYMKRTPVVPNSYYLFAINNPREALQGKAKMEFSLKGPFIYNLTIIKEDIAFSDGGERLRFRTVRELHLDETKSADLDERVWLMSPLVPSMLKAVHDKLIERLPFKRFSEPVLFSAIELVLDQYKMRLISRTTPRDFLQGKPVDLLVALTGMAKRLGLASMLGDGLPRDNTFGLAFNANLSGEVVELYTGTGAARGRFAEVARWRNSSEASVWSGKCRRIQGTNGELYKPLVAYNQPIGIFFADLCRSFLLKPVRTPLGEQVAKLMVGGAHALEFEFAPELYMGSRRWPSNRCYCERPSAADCQLDGLMSMGPCLQGAPLYFARANFERTDARLSGTTSYLGSGASSAARLSGRQSVWLEPITGVVMEINLTLMAVLKVRNEPRLRALSKLQNVTYAPAFATSVHMSLPEEVGHALLLLQSADRYHERAALAALGLGALLLVVGRLLARH